MFKQARYFTPNRNYTRRFLHQRTSTPEEVLHQTVFTYQEPLIPKTFYTRNLSHHRHLTPKSWYMLTPENSYRKNATEYFLQQEPFTPKGFYTRNNLHQRAFYTQRLLEQTNCIERPFRRATITPKDVNTRIVYIQKTLTPELFISEGPSHQRAFTLHQSHQSLSTQNSVYTRKPRNVHHKKILDCKT